MSRKRSIFDIDIPDDLATPVVPDPDTLPDVAPRRGPMASAISENAAALQARADAAAAIRAENDALAHELVALREAGHVVEDLALDQVFTRLLMRDRLPGEDFELAELVTSIREVGLSNPIRVVTRPDGTGYELIQGYRRLSAYRALLEETGDASWGQIPALILPHGEDISGLYRRMVDENIVRKDLSFAEMATAALHYAADPATDAHDLKGAVGKLFQSAPYSKRSYIRAFARLLEVLGPTLMYPTEIPRALGVNVVRAIDEEPDLVRQIKSDLHDWDTRSISDELNVLRRYSDLDALDMEATVPAGSTAPRKPAAQKVNPARTKTTFDVRTRAGRVRCTAGVGRLEIKLDRDFSAMDRGQLERAIASLIDGMS
ncbi:ParB/RepB/Spo0J family partition protein [Roseicitreum antarcticum]|uniref:Chromosome partitioning protein, ParB family n=1 Tax=Roseicitreum antarcticum TaxID=564137 RepID=A0A1H2Z6P7_9RHOB|nr:ParB/RepB/Spo0J family partition protein [Roseicitreum antarcticum]SDX12997.1 chromosome partitioning protein, ParB family [Roseicitreum antarcticum]